MALSWMLASRRSASALGVLAGAALKATLTWTAFARVACVRGVGSGVEETWPLRRRSS